MDTHRNCICALIVSLALLLTSCAQSPAIEKTLPTHSTLAESEECRPLPASGLPAQESVRTSNILFVAWNSDTDSSQVWTVSLESGSRRLVLDDLPSPYLSVAFLEDGYRFLLAGSHNVWQSDLSGVPLEQLVEPSKFLPGFLPYSPMWNALAYSSGLSEALDYQIGRIHSPDGTKVAIWQKGDTALRIVDKVSNEEFFVLSTDDQDAVSGNWSPDGEHFAFTYYQNGEDWHSQMYLVNADGTGLHPITERYTHSMLGRPNWSPDGKQIAISWEGVALSTYSYRLYLLEPVTGETRSFDVEVSSAGNQAGIVWSSDNKWIAFLTDNLGSESVRRDVQVVSLETGEVFCITQDASIREELIDWH
jgi:dipeptidyl aminopeptidase/acylaminoacyl peptidase